MASATNGMCSTFVYLFNKGKVFGETYPKEEQKEKFEILNGDEIQTYCSTNYKSKVLNQIEDNILSYKVEIEFDVIESEIIHDYNLVSDCIVSKLNVEKDQIKIFKLIPLKREGKKTTYLVGALVYSRLFFVLQKPFSLNELYLEYLKSNEQEKNVIKSFIQKLNFTKDSSVDLKIINNIKLEKLKEIGINFDVVTEKVEKANKNACLVQMFNLNDNIFNINVEKINYVDKDLEKNKQCNKLRRSSLKRKVKDTRKYTPID